MTGLRMSILLIAAQAACGVTEQPSPPAPAGSEARGGAELTLQPGTLGFVPDQPSAGEGVEVVYRAAGVLGQEPVLRLRARVRTAEDESYNAGMGSRTVALLHREPDGSHRGQLTLPERAVYAAFAVEDTTAAYVDSREGRFWELLVHDHDGRPLFTALEQRFNDHMGRDELVVLESARLMTRFYPDLPKSWTTLRAAEGWVLGAEGEEERTANHRERLRAFDREFRQDRTLTADQVGYVYWYSRRFGDDELTDHWRARLLEDHPGHFFAVQERTMEILRQHDDDPPTRLAALDALWARAADNEARARIVRPALSAARQVGDSAALLLWIDRLTGLDPDAGGYTARTLAANPATRAEGIRRLRAAIHTEEKAPDEERPLGATAADHKRSAVARGAALRTSLGNALISAGHTRDGIASLEKAAGVDWDVGRFRTLAQAHLNVGDTVGALRAFTAVAADPTTSIATADSLRIAAGATRAAWDEAVERAREEMVQRTLRSASNEAIDGATVELRTGTRAALEDLLGEEATVIVLWSRYCGYSVQAMPRIATLADDLATTQGVRLLAITRDSPEQAEPFLEEGGWPIEVAFDTRGEAARALKSWGTPQYFVLDSAGRLRYAYSSLEELPRQLMALTGTAPR